MSSIIKRSPFFYVGDKYKLTKQLLNIFPKKIENFYEPFVGGGTVSLNVKAKKFFLNDIDKNLINIHQYLAYNAQNPDLFFENLEKIIHKYQLSCSYKKDIVPTKIKKEFKKTYYAKFNKKGYYNLRLCVNSDKKNDPLILYILLIYGFNRMLRFNQKGDFNLPVGNVDLNKNVINALNDYFSFIKRHDIEFTNKDFRRFLIRMKLSKDDFIYFDPPYLITYSEYNKLWGEKEEKDLLNLIDSIDKKGIKFALSNVIRYNGCKNDLLISWMKKYRVHNIRSNYISYHNNTQKRIREVLITNY